jgi:hypothetical protein
MSNNHNLCVKYALIFCFLLYACAPRQQTSIPATAAVSSTVEATTTIFPTVEVTATISTQTPDNQKIKDIFFSPCLTINPEPPGGNEIQWLLLARRAAIYTIDPNNGLKSNQLIPPPDPNSNSPSAYDFSLSPDGKWLTYILYGENDHSFVIEPSDNLLTNSSQDRIVWTPNQPFNLEGWLSNETIMLVMNHSLENFGTTLAYNPFTGEQHEFSLEEMPNSLKQQYGMSGSYLMDQGNLIPDPTLTRIVYPLDLDLEGMQLALWDVKNKKILAHINYAPFDQWSRSPFWSQDGSDFLIAGLSEEKTIEWFQVTKDGLIHQLTHFGEFLNRANFNLPSRSWDGRYLAFQLPYNQNQQGTYDDSKYFFLNLKSQSLDGFCIDYGDKSLPDKPLAWSPDSQYVVLTHGTIGERSAEVILVDIQKQKAFQIATDVEAIGWMVKP